MGSEIQPALPEVSPDGERAEICGSRFTPPDTKALDALGQLAEAVRELASQRDKALAAYGEYTRTVKAIEALPGKPMDLVQREAIQAVIDAIPPWARPQGDSEPAPNPDTDRAWFVWCNEKDHRGWWGPNRSGYHRDEMAAGAYTKAEAEKICRQSDYGWPPDSLVPNQVMVYVGDVDLRVRKSTLALAALVRDANRKAAERRLQDLRRHLVAAHGVIRPGRGTLAMGAVEAMDAHNRLHRKGEGVHGGHHIVNLGWTEEGLQDARQRMEAPEVKP